MTTDSITVSARQRLIEALHHLDHVLPGQAPIHDFVHHNTLHGFQHLPFEQALDAFEAKTGIRCYLPESEFRALYRQGRIDDVDLQAALKQHYPDAMNDTVCQIGECVLTRQQLYRLSLLYPLEGIDRSRFDWLVQEYDALNRPQSDLPESQQLFWRDGLGNLWPTLLEKLAITLNHPHPEDGSDTPSSAETDFGNVVAQLFDRVGNDLTLRGLLQLLAGIDVLDQVRPQLIRFCASLLDEGLAAWQMPQRQQLGFYAAWRASLDCDAQAFFNELADWPNLKAVLPDDPLAAIEWHLTEMAIPSARWPGYLERLALELPGWSGMINWRQTHPLYQTDNDAKPQLVDYLAIRLTLDRAWLNDLCWKQWHLKADFAKLRAYFDKHSAELLIRQSLFNAELPEHLSRSANQLIEERNREPANWQALARQINQCRNHSDQSGLLLAWRLFRACQWLQLNATEINASSQTELLNLLHCIDRFDDSQRRVTWLNAYEHHYQQQLLLALKANDGRGRWAQRDRRPEAQIIFCMDDREESIRRHLEELNPRIETLGAAGFFGVAMNYQGLDDIRLTPLCPVVVTPSHNVEEHPQTGQEALMQRHSSGLRLKQRIANLLHHGLRRHQLLAYPLIHLTAPLVMAGLLGKSFFPKVQQQWLEKPGRWLAPELPTQLQFTARDCSQNATPEQPRLGFTDQEQADRVAAFLRNTGLTYGFAKLVALMGHGSISQNNPHLAAYDCGACSGRHGGPNARLFAAMANRLIVRQLLAERGIAIPADTWFLGGEHNTCDEEITWFDLDALPEEHLPAFEKLTVELRHSQRMSAHERCRRLASAPRQPKPQQALKHFLNRASDFSQARPELGHATNASALVGRRSLTQGAFFDRRLFLISYDPTQDPEGLILEGILLAVGPVGAGINLEYYFSTVNNERLGCSSKVPHNLTGFFGVMEGASSDLRTGLPKQMIEIHEAMRLQLVVEAKTEVLEKIYARQQSLRELIGGGWLHLIAKDPGSSDLSIFQRGVGFVRWQADACELPLRDNSPDCYRDATGPVSTMLIKQPVISEASA